MRVIELNKGFAAVVDDDTYDQLAQYRWRVDMKGYAERYIPSDRPKGTNIKMHREIMMAEKGHIVDHINGNKLDNRRCNLRFATNGQNRANSKVARSSKSGLKGVRKQKNKFRATIKANGKAHHIGYFKTAKEAHAAYCDAAIKLHGEFARFN